VAAGDDVAQLWRRTLDAYVDYYRSVGRLTANYARAVAGTAGALRAAASAPARPAPAPPPPPSPTSRPTVALEATAGSTAVGMFVVENTGSSTVSGPIEVPSLVDPDGREIELQVGFEPDRVTLDPGEQTVVQAAVEVGRSLREGVDYRGEVRVPGPPGTSVPIVVRRLAAKRRASSGRAQATR
jgi:hypothetical protein